MNRTNGKIAEESRAKMISALLQIMKIYDYREITITQIVQEAGLSRNTFYRLFKDKDEILTRLFEDLYNEFFTQIQKNKIESFWNVMQLYFDFWQQKKELLMLLSKNHLLERVLNQAYNKSGQVFQLVHKRDEINTQDAQLPYLLAFSVGGMHMMLIKWAESNMDVPSEVLIKNLRSCLMYDGLSQYRQK